MRHLLKKTIKFFLSVFKNIFLPIAIALSIGLLIGSAYASINTGTDAIVTTAFRLKGDYSNSHLGLLSGIYNSICFVITSYIGVVLCLKVLKKVKTSKTVVNVKFNKVEFVEEVESEVCGSSTTVRYLRI